jgi:aminoacyl-tRNA hydrolase
MQSRSRSRRVTFGLGVAAQLRGRVNKHAWPDRLSLIVTWNAECVPVQTRLCGRHWAPVVLAALATAVALGVPLQMAGQAVARIEPFEGRMSPVPINGVTFIRDDWKAPIWSIPLAFDFMREATAERKIIVVGTLSDYSGPNTPRYVRAARQALAVADCVLFVGARASACLRAKESADDPLFAFPSLRKASTFLSTYLRPGDLVLLKGSVRSDHLERLVLALSESVACWRTACGRAYFCQACSLLHQPASAQEVESPDDRTGEISEGAGKSPSSNDRAIVVVVGLGNADEQYSGTRHNVGRAALDVLAERLGGTWKRYGSMAMISDVEWDQTSIALAKLAGTINETGPVLQRLAHELRFTLDQCILLHDDLDLPIGAVRARYRGGDGGHRGVQSVIQTFQNDKVRRVKIGIGKPRDGQSVADFVLTPFLASEAAFIAGANREAAARVLDLIHEASVSARNDAPSSPSRLSVYARRHVDESP